MKKKSISISLTIILLVCLAVSVCADYVGSVRSDIYHYSGCYWAKQIRSYNQIWFENVAQAKNYGYRACNVCKPPSGSYAGDNYASGNNTYVNYTSDAHSVYEPSIVATDIRAFVNGYEIPTFAYSGDDRNGTNSCIVVLAEDLVGYGFDVEWNSKTNCVYVSDNDYKGLNPIPMNYYRNFKKGMKMFDIERYSNVQVILKNGYKSRYVNTKYTLNGYVAILVDELANIAEFSWNEYSRTISIVSR